MFNTISECREVVLLYCCNLECSVVSAPAQEAAQCAYISCHIDDSPDVLSLETS